MSPSPVGVAAMRRRPRGPSGATAFLVSIVLVIAAGCGPGSTPGASPSPSASPTASPSPAASPSAAGSPSGSAGTLDWGDCGAGLQCGRIEVPLDHAKPDGTKIEIYLAKLPARDRAHRIGSLVLNFGGPGAPGVLWLQSGIAQALPDALRDRFDLVSFDPRGTGLSSPIPCVDASTMDAIRAVDPLAETAAQREAVERAARQFAAGCASSYPTLLPHISTEDVARDMDVIRAALGEDRMTYLGYSYGTYLGARYATLFPERVRAFVLDGAIDANDDPITIAEDQLKAAEAALDRFFAYCAPTKTCAFHGRDDPAAAFDHLRARIEATPIEAGGGRSLRIGDAIAGIWALLGGGDFEALAAALSAAEGGDGSTLLAQADQAAGRDSSGQYDAMASAGQATLCMDARSLPALSAWIALADRSAREAPHVGRIYTLGCTYWPVHPAAAPTPLVAPAGTPLVVIGSIGDPTTPYAWSQRMVKTLGNAVLVTRQGEGHTSLADPSNGCIAGVVSAYLVDLRVPAAGLTC